MARRMHILKSWPDPFLAQWSGLKNFEIRLDDRNYQIGDLITLREYSPNTGNYSGRQLGLRITHITDFEQKPGYVVLGTTPITEV